MTLYFLCAGITQAGQTGTMPDAVCLFPAVIFNAHNVVVTITSLWGQFKRELITRANFLSRSLPVGLRICPSPLYKRWTLT